jgi:membrane protein required for colicin V production
LNGADIALLLILAVSMAVGMWRGFVVEVLSLTVWIAAFWLSMGFGDGLADRLTGIEDLAPRLFLGYAGVFIAVLIVGGLVTWAIGKFIANTGLSATDRVLGLGFGLLRALVLACVAVLLMGFTTLPQEPWWNQSQLMPPVQRGAQWLESFLPPAAAEQIHFGPRPAPEAVPSPGTPPAAPAPNVPES